MTDRTDDPVSPADPAADGPPASGALEDSGPRVARSTMVQPHDVDAASAEHASREHASAQPATHEHASAEPAAREADDVDVDPADASAGSSESQVSAR